ncbi:cyclodeaminase/cyclohydrolase family protein [Deinococcus planocerae]|uniref:cyclodeaminase/cyclohydrolase family protein n=1 Tax=Deinococcus planocerae TaxID=1737569 RepID=UPI000C7F784A|nr:cyclodeaminase/cyclohydrolase family protein [Deinococcus planocerae]
MSSLWDRPVRVLLQETASPAPTPGGGSVAALSGAFGAALVTMALEISLGKQPGEAEGQAMRDLLAELARHRERLQALADEDVAAFGGYMDALALPRGSEEERRGRRAALREATRAATAAPLETARAVVEVLDLAPRAAELAHKEVVSDVGAGAALLRGALQASLLTVDINVPGWPEGERAGLRAEREDLETRGGARADEVLRRTQERLGAGE